MNICQFSLNISAWNMVCNKQLSVEDWRLGEDHWFANLEQFEDNAPKLAFLPPLKRRRLSDSARLFFESAWDLVGEDANMPVVYASLNGEINRSFALWEGLIREGDVSPTSFSLSVHNALIGQWSEMRQVKSEIMAITAQQDSLETALMEAYLLLNDGVEKVLVVVCESPLKAEYNVHPLKPQPFSYALAMIVEQGEQWLLTLQNQPLALNPKADNALSFVQNSHLTLNEWRTPASRGGSWQWKKQA